MQSTDDACQLDLAFVDAKAATCTLECAIGLECMNVLLQRLFSFATVGRGPFMTSRLFSCNSLGEAVPLLVCNSMSPAEQAHDVQSRIEALCLV